MHAKIMKVINKRKGKIWSNVQIVYRKKAWPTAGPKATRPTTGAIRSAAASVCETDARTEQNTQKRAANTKETY